LFSAALSRASRLVGVTHHRILQSPDFPPARYSFGTKNAVHRERGICILNIQDPIWPAIAWPTQIQVK